MKQINIEDQKFLEELSEKMNTQDKRSTSYPLFVVFDREKVYREDGEETERDENYDGEVCEECETNYADGAGDDYPDECLNCPAEAFRRFNWEDRIQENDGIFFTADACNEYIERRRYAFNKPYSYAISSYHSEEMKRVMEIISKLTANDNPLK